MTTTAEKAKHTPGDVNHQLLGHAGYEFCPTCGSSLRGKRTALETEMLEALEDLLPKLAAHGMRTDEVKAAIRKARGEQR